MAVFRAHRYANNKAASWGEGSGYDVSRGFKVWSPARVFKVVLHCTLVGLEHRDMAWHDMTWRCMNFTH